MVEQKGRASVSQRIRGGTEKGRRVIFALLVWVAFLTSPVSSALYLNEMMSSNGRTIADEDGDYPDWVEIYNSGPEAVDLAGYGLSDRPASPFKWVFPSKIIQPGEFLLVFCSDKNRKEGPYLHTSFAISAQGETIVLTNPDGTTVDVIEAVALTRDQSLGRQPDGGPQFFFFLQPTPGAPNTTQGYASQLGPLSATPLPGFHTENTLVTITSSDPGVTIRYTTDGSIPNESSPVYEGPIPVTSRVGQPPIYALIPTNPPEAPWWEIWRPPVGDVFLGTVIRARAFKIGHLPGPVATWSYFIDPTGRARYSLPVISLVTEPENLFDFHRGIYVPGVNYVPGTYPFTGNYLMSGSAWERPAHIEFFEPDGLLGFSQNVGIRIHGGYSTSNYPQKSLRLYADGYSPAGEFQYGIFPGYRINAFKRLILRNSGNDWLSTIFRDGMIQGLMEGTNVDLQAYRPCIVFINGEFWGIHNIRERYDRHYITSHHGVEDVDLLEITGEIAEGDDVAWKELQNYVASHDLREAEAYGFVASRVDLDNFIDYNLIQIFCQNCDWPSVNCRFWRPRTPDGKWRWMLFDTDAGFAMNSTAEAARHDTLAFACAAGGTKYPNADHATRLLRGLLRNRDFRSRFVNRMADFLNSRFQSATIIAQIDQKQAAIAPHIGEHLRRWGRTLTVTGWERQVDMMRQFATLRPDQIRSHFVRFFGLSGTCSVTLRTSGSGSGAIRINTLTITPDRLPWEGIYFQDIPVEVEAIPSPGSVFAGWEGIAATGPSAVLDLPATLSLTARFEVQQ